MTNLANSLTVLLLLSLPFSVLAHEGTEHYGPHMMWQGYGMMMGPIMMILFIAAIVVVGVLIFRWLGGHGIGPSANSKEEPIEVLRSRFARGEITKEEFEEHLELLRRN